MLFPQMEQQFLLKKKDKKKLNLRTTMDQIHRIRELYYEQDKNLKEIAIIMN